MDPTKPAKPREPVRYAEPRWHLEPFTDVHYVGDLAFGAKSEQAFYRGALLLVLDGKVAAARLPAIRHTITLGTEGTWDLLEQWITDIVERLAALTPEQRIDFFVTVAEDETVDIYLHLQLLEEQ